MPSQLEVLEHRVRELGPRALRVEVLVAQHETAAGLERPLKRGPEGAGVADVQEARGRGRDPAAVLRSIHAGQSTCGCRPLRQSHTMRLVNLSRLLAGALSVGPGVAPGGAARACSRSRGSRPLSRRRPSPRGPARHPRTSRRSRLSSRGRGQRSRRPGVHADRRLRCSRVFCCCSRPAAARQRLARTAEACCLRTGDRGCRAADSRPAQGPDRSPRPAFLARHVTRLVYSRRLGISLF